MATVIYKDFKQAPDHMRPFVAHVQRGYASRDKWAEVQDVEVTNYSTPPRHDGTMVTEVVLIVRLRHPALQYVKDMADMRPA